MNKQTLAVVLVLLAVVGVLGGYYAVVKNDDGDNNETTGVVVSEEPIPLVLINYNQPRGTPDFFGRIQNFADPSNKGKIVQGVRGEDWEIKTAELEELNGHYNVTITFMEITGNLTTELERNTFFPDRIDLNFAGIITGFGDLLIVDFGKESYARLLINSSNLGNDDFITLWMNLTDGERLINISPLSLENATLEGGGYYNFVIDPPTGNIMVQIRSLMNCSAGDYIFKTNIGSFSFAPTPDNNKVYVRVINEGGMREAMFNLGLFQNPLVGQYESLNIEYCDVMKKRPLG